MIFRLFFNYFARAMFATWSLAMVFLLVDAFGFDFKYLSALYRNEGWTFLPFFYGVAPVLAGLLFQASLWGLPGREYVMNEFEDDVANEFYERKANHIDDEDDRKYFPSISSSYPLSDSMSHSSWTLR